MFHFHRKPVERIITDRLATLSGKSYAYTLVQTSRELTVKLNVIMNKVLEIVVPRRFHTDHIDHIVAKHEAWILKQLDKLEARKNLREKHHLADGVSLTVLGEPHMVKIMMGSRKKPSVRRVQQLEYIEDRAVVGGHRLHVYCDGSIGQAKGALEDYLRVIAEKYFNRRAKELGDQMDVIYKNITIRGQKTRWGSCSREKNLNFNWRLIMLPVEVADSVIVHELAHTLHMNHSRAFYGLVERFCPDYRRLQKHLRNPQFLV